MLGQSGGRQSTIVGVCGPFQPQAFENESPANQVPLGTMDDVFEIVRRADRPLAVIEVPEMTILAVNEACVELFGAATSLVGCYAGSLFRGADQVHASIALSALAAGAIDSYNARRRVPTRANAEAWVCVRTFDVEGVHIALATVVLADEPRPLDAVEQELATATHTRWVSPASSTGRSASSRPHCVTDTYSVLDGLSPRQRTIIAALMQGERTSSIASSQFVSESTIRSHLSAIYRAFGVHSQTELLSMLRMRNSSSAGAGPPNR